MQPELGEVARDSPTEADAACVCPQGPPDKPETK